MMKQIACFLLVLLLLPALCMADTIILKNGDVFKGVIQNKSFELDTPYGAIRVLNQNVKSIQPAGKKDGGFELLTVNNDLFSGNLAENTVNLSQATGRELPIAIDRIERMVFDYDGPTFQANTTLYFMKNGDLFSGTLLNPSFHIRTKHETLEYKTSDFSRIDFFKSDAIEVEALLDNKTFVKGDMLENQLMVQPECVSSLSLCKRMIRKIQFNVQKLVKVKALPAIAQTYDSDGDGVPDAIDKCPNTPCGARVDGTGCSETLDADGDGVPDTRDRCAQTPKGLHVNATGCWAMNITNFQFDQAKIKAQFYPMLDKAAGILAANPQIKIQVQGNTDSRGSMQYNQHLSMKRAEAVVRYLIAKGVKPDQLTAVGYGAKHPIATNDTESGRAKNRRVQLVQMH